MDDFVKPGMKGKPRISEEEMMRRRQILEDAAAHSRIEGLHRDPSTDAIFEAFVRGEIDVTDMVPRLKAQLGLK